MNDRRCCVMIIVDRNFGDRVLPLSRMGQVWLIESPANREARQRWVASLDESDKDDLFSGITIFGALGGTKPEEDLADVLDTVLDHVPWKADPQDMVLEIYGVSQTECVEHVLEDAGLRIKSYEPGCLVCSLHGID